MALIDRGAPPLILALTGTEASGGWLDEIGGRGAFDLLRATSGDEAVVMVRTCRADLLVIDLVGPGSSPLAEGLWIVAAAPTRRLPVVLQTPPMAAAPDVHPGLVVEDAIPASVDPDARLRAVLRRTRPTVLTSRLDWNGLELRDDARTATWQGKPVPLTLLEFNVLALLLEEPGREWTRAELCRGLWGVSGRQKVKSVNRPVQGLRRRLAAVLGHDPIGSVVSKGYSLRV